MNPTTTPANRAIPADDVSRRSKMAIGIFVITSLFAGLVYAGKQFASREIVVTASQTKPMNSAAARPAAELPHLTAAAVKPAEQGKPADGNVVDMTY